MIRAVVLLSGGQDSTTCLFWAKHKLGRDGEPVELHALSVYYAQRHHTELSAAARISRLAGCESHVEVDLGVLMTGGDSRLLAANADRSIAPRGGMKDREMPDGLPTSFVPGRNLLFLAAAAARAGAVGAETIVTGVCEADYSGYPDCRASFIAAMDVAIGMAWPSMERAPRVIAPLMAMSKAATVKLALELAHIGLKPYENDFASSPVWQALASSVTCYEGRRPGCGVCPACRLRARGFDEAGLVDPAEVMP